MLILFYVLGALFCIIGAKGFTKEGLAFSSTTQIKGKTGRIIGGICIGFGVALIGLSIWITVRISS